MARPTNTGRQGAIFTDTDGTKYFWSVGTADGKPAGWYTLDELFNGKQPDFSNIKIPALPSLITIAPPVPTKTSNLIMDVPGSSMSIGNLGGGIGLPDYSIDLSKIADLPKDWLDPRTISGPSFGMGPNVGTIPTINFTNETRAAVLEAIAPNLPTRPIITPPDIIDSPITKDTYVKPKDLQPIKLLPPSPPPPLPPPKIIRTDGGSTIKTEIVSNTISEEVVEVFKNSISFVINVVDDIFVPVPDIREIEYPIEVRGADFQGLDVDFDFSWNSVNTTFVRIYVGNSKEYIQEGPRGNIVLNVDDIVTKYIGRSTINDETDKIKISISMVPYNMSGREPVIGKTERFTVLFDKGDNTIPRSVAVNRIVEGFTSQFDFDVFDTGKLLTHLLHLGNGDNKIVTTWVGLKDDGEYADTSLILKLYEPLPTSVQPNQQTWISKIQAEPIVETITLVGDSVDYCPPLKGANFQLEPDNGIGYQIYDDLLGSGSETSNSLINKYTNGIGIDTENLNIQYSSGSIGEVFLFDNFVHFGSAEERIKNFYYKIQLLETYESTYEDLTGFDVVLGTITTEEGFELVAEGSTYDGFSILGEVPNFTTETKIQAEKVLAKINGVIQTFDGFEKYLYESNDASAYPKTNGILDSSTSSNVLSWYNTSITYGNSFDKNNVDYLVNNLPEYIKEDYQNEEFMLFLDMIGQHFDTIWSYTNSLSKIKNLNQHSTTGFSNDLVYHLLESMGWEGKKAFDSQYLWEYAFGQYKDGTQKYDRSLKSANEEVWRRILNNLPYLLKHKGTSRSLKAAMACYGVPQSLLTIMEFGGPQDPTEGGTSDFTYEDRTAAINFTNSGEYIETSWKIPSGETTTPNSVELRVNLLEPGDYNIARVFGEFTGTPMEYWRLSVTQTTGSYGYLSLHLSGSITQQIYELSTNEFNIFNEEYTQIVINRTSGSGANNTFQIFAKEAVGNRIRTDIQSDTLTISGETSWDTGSLVNIQIGYEMTGSIDEFRLWTNPLDESVIETHTLLPDATNGNSYTSSTEDLVFRLDFEYPKDRKNDTDIINVAVSNKYGVSVGTAVGFPSASLYPYQYTPYDRTVTAKVPSLGFNSSDKIRFEEQTLVGDLSHKVRATKKAFDRAPIDSSRLGLFFSPIKELNMDILKSFGSFNIDDYIGAPDDEYNDEYTSLKTVRDYYFQRLNRNIYEYINLVRQIDKSLFDVLTDLAPARAKVSKGLLIEPHLLERSKVKWNKPTSERGDYDSTIDAGSNVTIESSADQYLATLDTNQDVQFGFEYNNYDVSIDVDDSIDFTTSYPTYDSSIEVDDDINLIGNPLMYDAEIVATLGEPLIQATSVDIFSTTQVGMDKESLNAGGFGLYAENGVGIISELDIFGNYTSSRQQIYKIKESYVEKVTVQTEGWPATTNNEQVKYEIQEVTNYRYKITKLPFGSNDPVVGNNVVEVTPLNGYFPSHYRNTNNLNQGLIYSFFDGSKQTSATTPDGLSPVETFTTNPNILRVADTGRGSGEPILEVN
jgi:hypothetical protein